MLLRISPKVRVWEHWQASVRRAEGRGLPPVQGVRGQEGRDRHGRRVQDQADPREQVRPRLRPQQPAGRSGAAHGVTFTSTQ